MRSRILFGLCFISVVVGQPSFSAADINTSVHSLHDLAVADMDNDGDSDILLATSDTDDALYWLENNGAADPSWNVAAISNTTIYGIAVDVADLDNDGDMDILTASYNDDRIAWYENDGATDPSWTYASIATSANGAYDVFSADLDNDGDMDIVSASYLDDAITWYENDGASDPSWTAADIATSADGARSVYGADLDNDGDMDIVSASY